MSHVPVLLQEVIKFLDPQPGAFIIDGTLGSGGHAKEIYKKISPDGTLLGIDWDLEVVQKTAEEIKNQESEVILVSDNYSNTIEMLIENKVKADGLLLDLGFSTDQLDSSGRGFSFLKDEPLIMTYSRKSKPVMEILKEKSETELADIIFKLSGERKSRKIAKAIKEEKEIKTTAQLVRAIQKTVPQNYERGRINPATRTFQALRIYANDELGNLERTLEKLPELLEPNGRTVVISFHSLEDKIVKDSFRIFKRRGLMEILTKKPVTPTREEVQANPRSRSAKLRAAKMI